MTDDKKIGGAMAEGFAEKFNELADKLGGVLQPPPFYPYGQPMGTTILINLDLKAPDWDAMDAILAKTMAELAALRAKVQSTDNQACIEFSVPGLRIVIDPQAPDYPPPHGVVIPQIRRPHRG